MVGRRGAWAGGEGEDEAAMGDDHPNTLTSISNLAVTYMRQDRWTDAVKLWYSCNKQTVKNGRLSRNRSSSTIAV
jgi:hypothetical protein